MISICIPVYNTDVVALATELSNQLERLQLGGEIIILDDFSSSFYKSRNAELALLKNIQYKELEKNVGRFAIRKMLADTARYEWLLFLDGDSRIQHPDFLANYANIVQDPSCIYIGGRDYGEEPVECNKKLHWKYGTMRESVKGKKSAFHSNNFCIHHQTFQQIAFLPELKGYGYEDIWIGMELERLNKKMIFIDNPIIHDGIENTDVFLRKSTEALSNLLVLEKLADRNMLRRHVRLYQVFSSLKRYRLIKFFAVFYYLFSKRVERNLYSCKASLFLFDIHRLIQFYDLRKKVLKMDR